MNKLFVFTLPCEQMVFFTHSYLVLSSQLIRWQTGLSGPFLPVWQEALETLHPGRRHLLEGTALALPHHSLLHLPLPLLDKTEFVTNNYLIHTILQGYNV